MQHNAFDIAVDARGLNCPLPILKARQALMKMDNGQILQVIATDPVSAEDFPVFAEATPHELVATEQVGDDYIFWLKKGEIP